MKLTIPELSLVVLIGPSGSGKSTFARRHFKPSEVLSSDAFRALVSDDENDQSASGAAFEVLHLAARKRLQAGKLTVVDATSVQEESRRPLVALARECHAIPVAIVLDLPGKLCEERNRARPDRDFAGHVIAQQRSQLRRSLRGLGREGFRRTWVLKTPEEVESVELAREPLWTDRRSERGPFAIVGDVHGCFDELKALLERLGYAITVSPDGEGSPSYSVQHPAGRKAVFLGDLVDRGPRIPEVLRLVMDMVESGIALCIPGNHDVKLLRKLRGADVRVTHGLAESLSQIEAEPAAFRERVMRFLDGLISHYVLDDGKLVVAHAGMREEMQGRGSARVREFALYGDTTGETDEFGLPVRYPWAEEYRGRAMVVYGHTPVPEAEWLNRTINIDTGCVFGGKLTALLYPEKELVSVPAARTYSEPAKPFLPEGAAPPALTLQQAHDDLLDMEDVQGKRFVRTRLGHPVRVREENAAAALEVMSRFAVDPRWLIYLPPTMSPCETSSLPGYLEHPAEAFAYYRLNGVPGVVCEEKHMGSRAVVIACRDPAAAHRRFGALEEGPGMIYTRTGRRFFSDPRLEAEVLDGVRAAAEAGGLWEELRTDWMCLDCELMPWSVKAAELIRGQYAAVGAASRMALGEAAACLERAGAAGVGVEALLDRHRLRLELAGRYVEAYRRFGSPLGSPGDLRLAPFHLLATEDAVHLDKGHPWHLSTLSRLYGPGGRLLQETRYRVVDLTDPTSEKEATTWWEEMTREGAEGMVVKPAEFIARGRRGLLQPALKCRGQEYLRIIYGPEYSLPEHLERLRSRGLGAKRSLALREFALGLEALERFVRREPLRRVHECVFAVLALESEPVDPRL